MFCFTAAIRNLKFNKISAILTFVTIIAVCALMTLGIRIFLPAYDAFKSARTYASVYEAMAYTTAFVTVICIIGGIVMLCGLAPSASDKKKNILKIYADIGATAEQIFAINLIEMLVVTIAACPLGIWLGEDILHTQQDWISSFAQSIEFDDGPVVWIFVAIITIVMVVASCLAFSCRSVNWHKKAAIRDAYPSKIYQNERGYAGIKLGWINFIRRRRPTSIIIMFIVSMVIFNVLCNSVSYAEYLLTSGIYNVNQSYNVVFTYDLYDECMETYSYFKEKYNCAVFSSPSITVKWTTSVTEDCAEAHSKGQENAASNCMKMVVPDDDFYSLTEQIGTVISPNEADGISAILINRTYDYNNYYKPYYIFDDTSVPSYGTVALNSYTIGTAAGTSAPVTVIGYTDEWPEGYDWNGYYYGLIMCESDFLTYFGDLTGEYYNGLHYIRFIDCEGIYDEIYGFISAFGVDIGRSTGPNVSIYDREESSDVIGKTITFVKNYVNLMFIFALAVLFVSIVIILDREAKSRREEFAIYSSLGMSRGTFFTMMFTDYILLFTALFIAALALSVILSLPFHWLILGYLKSFYIKLSNLFLCLACIAIVSALFALYYAVKSK